MILENVVKPINKTKIYVIKKKVPSSKTKPLEKFFWILDIP